MFGCFQTKIRLFCLSTPDTLKFVLPYKKRRVESLWKLHCLKCLKFGYERCISQNREWERRVFKSREYLSHHKLPIHVVVSGYFVLMNLFKFFRSMFFIKTTISLFIAAINLFFVFAIKIIQENLPKPIVDNLSQLMKGKILPFS